MTWEILSIEQLPKELQGGRDSKKPKEKAYFTNGASELVSKGKVEQFFLMPYAIVKTKEGNKINSSVSVQTVRGWAKTLVENIREQISVESVKGAVRVSKIEPIKEVKQ